MSDILLMVCILVGVAVILDRFKRVRRDEGPIQKIPLSADEVGPTQTGKFRVQEMLSSTEAKKEKPKKTKKEKKKPEEQKKMLPPEEDGGKLVDTVENFNEDLELPDPFDS